MEIWNETTKIAYDQPNRYEKFSQQYELGYLRS